MFTKFYSIGRNLRLYLEENIVDVEASIIPFGIFGFISYPLFYLINLYLLAPQRYSAGSLRAIIGCLCFSLIFKNYWPAKMRPYLPAVWYFTLFLSLPFFATFMCLQNNFSAAWVLNSLSIIILLMFLVDWVAYTILLISGIILGSLFAYFISPEALTHFTIDTQPLTFMDIITTILISIIMGVIFSRNKSLVEHGKLQAMKAVGASIAHELRTPLASISGGIEGAKRYIPKLIEGYELAKQANLSVPYIRPDHYKILTQLLDDLEAEVYFAHTIIDMLLLKVNFRLHKSDFSINSIKRCVEEAIQRYPFHSTEQKKLVHCNIKDDFSFQGERLFMIHVLFNLLKNALYFIDDARKGEIFIWTESFNNTNVLYFKDTSKGMNAYTQANLFKKFFTNTRNGTGLGLAFCKIVMEKFGGSINCETQEGEYSQFVLSFPAVSSPFPVKNRTLNA